MRLLNAMPSGVRTAAACVRRSRTDLLVRLQALLDGCPAEFAQQNLNGQGWVAAPKDCVKSLQTGLNKVSDANLDVDGVIGPLTTQAIRNFQAANGLKVLSLL